ncbi:recombinase family protein [Streptomyces fulvoviolaceus]|uniref:recombinase family protein n=1 Tax=Streptomyces fulvoviolaceus TaxID=285535 RepID=UPI000A6CCA6D|nr:recombinase family protein [Streptomyces fulvoviolaceus]
MTVTLGLAAGLSDVAVSPFAPPGGLLHGEVRLAWLGRCSTQEQQDPRQSLLRQFERCRSALPEAWVVVCHFYDVESGRLALDQRGRGGSIERFDVPIARDGGIQDLLAEAVHPGRRFDAVICESTARVARRMFESLSVERALEQAGVPLFAWNEPIKIGGGRAQQILQRRINQSVAEYEVFNALETSWGGLCLHVREGWNIGKPPYGYTARRYRHPNPVKAAKGQTKSRLEPDGARARTVTQIAHWRHHDRLGYAAIVDRLNADPATYPPPVPPGGTARARGAWGKSAVADLLRNPKYTGYQVFNRRARRSRSGAHNNPTLWVWSPQPVHEPLIPKWMYDALTTGRQADRGSRAGNTINIHPQTNRTYVLRGMVLHACNRRMFGKHRNGITYYCCQPQANNRGRPDAYASHPTTTYIREDLLLDALAAFYTDHVLRPHQPDLLATALERAQHRNASQRQGERDRLHLLVDDFARRQHNLLQQAQNCTVDDPYATALRHTYNDLEDQRVNALGALRTLGTTTSAESADTLAELLDALPYLARHLADAPEHLQRRLFETTQLTVRLHTDSDDISFHITLPEQHHPTSTSAALTDAAPCS